MTEVRDMVMETTVTQGIGTATLDGPVMGFQSFVDAGFADGAELFYCRRQQGGAWEVCRGTLAHGPPVVITQDEVLDGTFGPAVPVNWGEGTASVYCCLPADQVLLKENALSELGADLMLRANNLSDVLSASTARTNLGLGTAAVESTVPIAKGGTGATTAAAARTALGLGTAAVENTGTAAGNVLKLNGSAQIPAVDGSLLTGISTASFPSGTALLFGAAPPTGWTRVNETEQFVPMVARAADTPGASGGSWDVTGLTTDAATSGGTSITEANLPSHDHSQIHYLSGSGSSSGPTYTASGGNPISFDDNPTGSGTAHIHSIGVITVISNQVWRPRYKVWVKATKD